MDKKCRGCGLGEEVEKLREENESLKEDLQKLRLELYGLKASKKGKRDSAEARSKSKGRKLGPPKGHMGTSRTRPENVDREIVLRLESCPHCSGDVKPLKPRYRYAEELVPAELLATECTRSTSTTAGPAKRLFIRRCQNSSTTVTSASASYSTSLICGTS